MQYFMLEVTCPDQDPMPSDPLPSALAASVMPASQAKLGYTAWKSSIERLAIH